MQTLAGRKGTVWPKILGRHHLVSDPNRIYDRSTKRLQIESLLCHDHGIPCSKRRQTEFSCLVAAVGIREFEAPDRAEYASSV